MRWCWAADCGGPSFQPTPLTPLAYGRLGRFRPAAPLLSLAFVRKEGRPRQEVFGLVGFTVISVVLFGWDLAYQRRHRSKLRALARSR